VTVEELDPTLVIAFVGFIAAFAAGAELSQVSNRRTIPHTMWQRNKALWSIGVVAMIVGGIWAAHTLTPMFP
jgi:hypothetical protein